MIPNEGNVNKFLATFTHIIITRSHCKSYVYYVDNEDKLDNQKTTNKGGGQSSNVNMVETNKSSFVTSPNSDSESNVILPEWGGNCTKHDWEKCSHLDRWVVSHYVDVKKPELGFKYHETDCTLAEVFCLTNGWTVTRCQLLCMQCNKGMNK